MNHDALIDEGIDLQIGNAVTELHDRGREDAAALVDQHAEGLAAFFKAAHRISESCDHTADVEVEDEDDYEDEAFQAIDEDPIQEMVSAVVYGFGAADDTEAGL